MDSCFGETTLVALIEGRADPRTRVIGESQLGLGDPRAAAETLARAKPPVTADPGTVAWLDALLDGRAPCAVNGQIGFAVSLF